MKVNGNLILNTDASGEIRNVFLHRLTTAERDALGLGLLQESQTIYNTDEGKFQYWDGADWQNTASEDFVQQLQNSFDGKPSVRLATVAALPAFTAAGSGVGKTLTADANGALTIDGIAAVLNDRVLVKNEGASDVDHGIYDVTDPGSGGTPWILTRSTDVDEDQEVTANMYVFVSEGTQQDSGWMLLTNDPIIVDTTALQFDQFSTPGFSGSVDDLSDVTLTSPAAGEVLLHDGSEFLNKKIQFTYDSSAFALPEITDVTTVADVSGSLSGTHFLIDSPTTPYYVWMDVATRAETTVVSFASGGGAFTAGGFPGDFWTFGDGSAGTGLPFYVWYDVTDAGGNTDPTPFPATEGITVPILSTDIASAVMSKTDAALNAFLHLGATAIVTSLSGVPGPTDLTMTNVATGAAADATASTAGGAGVSIGAITQGLNVAVDPAPIGRTGITVSFAGDSTALAIAIATAAAIDVFPDFSVPVPGTPTLTITNTAVNNVPDADDGGSEVTDITTVADVAGSLNSTFFEIDSPTTPYYVWYDVSGGGVDPAPGGRTGITVAITTNDGANAVAAATQAAIDANADFSATVLADVVTVTNTAPGAVTDAVDGSAPTGFGFVVVTQGVTGTGFTFLVTQQGVTSAATTHAINHNLSQKYCNVTVVNDSDFVILPLSIEFIDADNLTVTLSSAIDIKAVIIGLEGVGFN